MEVDISTLQNMLIAAGELGGTRALINAGVSKPLLTKQEAYSLYGRRNIDRYVKEGLIKFQQDGVGSVYKIDRMKLQSVALSSNRVTYMAVKDLI